MPLWGHPEIYENRTTEELKAQRHIATKAQKAQRLRFLSLRGIATIERSYRRLLIKEDLQTSRLQYNPYGKLDES